jgi:hypothetical protein
MKLTSTQNEVHRYLAQILTSGLEDDEVQRLDQLAKKIIRHL